jgi:hypothetical protein
MMTDEAHGFLIFQVDAATPTVSNMARPCLTDEARNIMCLDRSQRGRTNRPIL